MKRPKPTIAKVGARIGRTRIGAATASRKATEQTLKAGRLTCEEWNLRMIGLGGPDHPAPTVSQALAAGFLYLEIRCRRCQTHALLHLGAVNDVRRQPDLPISELRGILRCRHCTLQRKLPQPRNGPPWKPPAALVRLRRLRSFDFEPWYADDEANCPRRKTSSR